MTVIVIIGLLVTLLMSAVQGARETARRTQCLHTMREVGQAAILYESHENGYPGWNHPVIGPPPALQRYPNGWIFQLLPSLGRGDLSDPTVTVALNELLVCPSDSEKMALRAPNSPTSVVGNAGRVDARATATTPADWRANAGLVNRDDRDANGAPVKVDPTDASYIARGDGLAYTLLLTENLDAGTWYNFTADETLSGVVFWPPDAAGNFPPKLVHTINGPKLNVTTPYDTARPSSNHRGGVNMFFCDGHGRFVGQGIDYGVYCALMTPRGRNAAEPGTNPPTPSASQITSPPPLTEDSLR